MLAKIVDNVARRHPHIILRFLHFNGRTHVRVRFAPSPTGMHNLKECVLSYFM